MISDSWMFITLTQTILILLVVLIFVWSRTRTLKRQARIMEDRCNEAKLALDLARDVIERHTEHGDWKKQLNDRLETLQNSPVNASTRIHQAILNYELQDDVEEFDAFRAQLEGLLPAPEKAQPEIENSELKEQIEALQKQIHELEQSSPDTDSSMEEDLKALVQQFTSDSRDLLACIETLEAENQQLKSQQDAA